MVHNGGVVYSVDDLGDFAKICIDIRVFSEITIMKTAYWLTEDYYIYLSRDSNNPESILLAELRLKNPAEDTQKILENACREFGNHLIDQEVRQAVQTETAVVRDTLVQKAFFEGHPRADLANAEKSHSYS